MFIELSCSLRSLNVDWFVERPALSSSCLSAVFGTEGARFEKCSEAWPTALGGTAVNSDPAELTPGNVGDLHSFENDVLSDFAGRMGYIGSAASVFYSMVSIKKESGSFYVDDVIEC